MNNRQRLLDQAEALAWKLKQEAWWARHQARTAEDFRDAARLERVAKRARTRVGRRVLALGLDSLKAVA
jgi:uncharacterized Zn finger protein